MDPQPEPMPVVAVGTAPAFGNAASSEVSTKESNPPLEAKAMGGRNSASKPKTFKPGLHLDQGRQKLKGYSITRDQLDNLTHLGWLTTALWSFGTGLFGFAVNLQLTLDLSVGAPKDSIVWWSAINKAAIIAALALYALGGLMFWRGNSQKQKILDNTEFADDSK